MINYSDKRWTLEGNSRVSGFEMLCLINITLYQMPRFARELKQPLMFLFSQTTVLLESLKDFIEFGKWHSHTGHLNHLLTRSVRPRFFRQAFLGHIDRQNPITKRIT